MKYNFEGQQMTQEQIINTLLADRMIEEVKPAVKRPDSGRMDRYNSIIEDKGINTIKVTKDLFKSDLTNKEKYVYLLVKSKCVVSGSGKRDLFNMSKQKFCDKFGLNYKKISVELNVIARKGFLTKGVNKVKCKFGTSVTYYKLNKSEIDPQKDFILISFRSLTDHKFSELFKVIPFLLYSDYFFNNDGKVNLWEMAKESGINYVTLKDSFKFCESKGIIKNNQLNEEAATSFLIE
jgi:hypothetical protein